MPTARRTRIYPRLRHRKRQAGRPVLCRRLERCSQATPAQLNRSPDCAAIALAKEATLPLPGNAPALLEHGLRTLELKRQSQPLPCEMGEHTRVLGVLGHFGEFLTPRRMRTAFVRIPGHGVLPRAGALRKPSLAVKKRV